MTFVLSSLLDPIIYVSAPTHRSVGRNAPRDGARAASAVRYHSPAPHQPPAGAAHLSVAESASAFRAQYPVERAALAADAIAVSLAAAHDRVTAPLAMAAASFVRTGAWSLFGYARLGDHTRERFGRCGRSLQDLAALGEAMTRLARLERALDGNDGDRPLDRSAAVLVARVARADTIDHWIRLARALTVRELRNAIRSARAAERAAERDGAGVSDVAGKGDSAGAGDGDQTRDPVSAINRTGSSTLGPDPADDASAPRHLIKFLVPAAIRGIFDEALDLFRAVEGCEATVTGFIEALVADGMTGPSCPDWEVESAPLAQTDSRDAIERAHERSTGSWRLLPRAGRSDWALKMAGASLREFAALCERAGTGDAIELDCQIRELQRIEDEMERRLAELLATMADQGAWARLRFDGSGHYAEERLRISRSVAADRIRAARGLRRLPVIRLAYERGQIALEPTLHIIRNLPNALPDEQTQRLWVERACAATVKRMRDEAREIERRRLSSLYEKSDAPGIGGFFDGAAMRHGPVNGVSGDGECVDAESVGGEDVNGSSVDDAPADQGSTDRALTYLTPADHRPLHHPLSDADWRRSLLREPGTASRRVERLGRFTVANPIPDVFLRLRLPDDLAAALLSSIEARRRHLASLSEDNGTASARIALDFDDRCRRTPAWVGLLSLLRECLCRFHHQMGEHGALARCRGRAPLEVTWRIGRGVAATWWRNEIRMPG